MVEPYTPSKHGDIWQPGQQYPYLSLLTATLCMPDVNYTDLSPNDQLAVSMAYLVLGHDWGEYNVYHFAEQEIQRFTRLGLYNGQYLDLTAATLPLIANRLYAVLHREYCLVFYGREIHPDD